MIKISVTEARANLSAILSKCAYGNEQYVIMRRNKPVAALVSVDDLGIVEQHEERKGLASVVGKWEGFEEIVVRRCRDIAE
ncbi:type II toxin-antitoxin system Phd/YefM family antitoxin [Desulfatitalea alkaliphila]|uniref:Antitoxin n=1 Tax=Desulfatitalea alkaliphila TaxID=2929485 RepID=A0AA41UJZ2_9BACT|nr:type II toxin-antitoxin system Phd/YefM family antitoxin [Desulfatitalea alkaliphila]MCJ8502485.1 type II toxin-antitoxin system Phd/YefM family antitoxin [Desulfatitalea alkaliphila]